MYKVYYLHISYNTKLIGYAETWLDAVDLKTKASECFFCSVQIKNIGKVKFDVLYNSKNAVMQIRTIQAASTIAAIESFENAYPSDELIALELRLA